MTTLAVSDPWQPYEKGNKPVPEASNYGLVLIAVIIIVLVIRKYERK